MNATTVTGQAPPGVERADRAERIVQAMRESVAEVGVVGSTFERVAARAGVSRGLLHYYFGTKERLLVEVIRRDTDERIKAAGDALAAAHTVDEVIASFFAVYAAMAESGHGYAYMASELFVASRNNPEVKQAFAELYAHSRSALADILKTKEEEGVVRLRCDAESTLSHILSAGDGAVIQRILDPDREFGPADAVAWEVARFLLDTDGQG